MKMVLGVVRSEMAMHFSSKEEEPMLDKGAAHGQPTDWLRLLRTVWICLMDRDCPCEFA